MNHEIIEIILKNGTNFPTYCFKIFCSNLPIYAPYHTTRCINCALTKVARMSEKC